jgi:hypothetical protein
VERWTAEAELEARKILRRALGTLRDGEIKTEKGRSAEGDI